MVNIVRDMEFQAVLSGIIVVALRGMFEQTQDFRKFFKKK